MDYEDNDFQSQSFELAVEEDAKFCPGSHSYSLPKFDLDDSLQVHLRFDSLVESEVLLGIPSQEENQWIEDFSRESSGLEFSSGVAESCSISRRNNVWSEATSSESVDLLLKSVGQDEMTMGQTIVEESDNCDGVDSLANEMKPTSNQDVFSLSKTESPTCVGSLSTLDESVEQFSGLDKDVVDQPPQVEFTSKNGEGEMSINAGTSFLNSIEEKYMGCLFTNGDCNITGLKECTNLDNKHKGNKSWNDSAIPECIQNNPSTAVQSFVQAVDSNSDVPQEADGFEECEAKTVGDHEVLGRVTHCQACEEHLAVTDGNSVQNLSSLSQEVESISQVTELSSDAILLHHTAQVSGYEHMISSKDTDMVDQLMGNQQEASFSVLETEITSVAHSPDFSAGATQILSLDAPQGNSNGESVAKQEDSSGDIGHELEDGILISIERLSEEGAPESQDEGYEKSDGHAEHSSGPVVEMSSSTAITHETENSKDMEDKISSKDSDMVDQLLVNRQEASFFTVEREITSINTGLKECTNLDNKHEGNKSWNDYAIPKYMQNNPSTAVQSFVQAVDSNSDVPQEAVGFEKCEAETVGDHEVLGRVTNCQTCGEHLAVTDGDSVQNLSSLSQEVESISQITELSSDAILPHHTAQVSGYEHMISSKDTDMVDQLMGNQQEASFSVLETEITSVAHSPDFSSGATQILSLDATQGNSNGESVAKQEDSSGDIGHELGDGILISIERLSEEGTTESQGEGYEKSDGHAEYSSGPVIEMCSSTAITHETENSKDMEDKISSKDSNMVDQLLVNRQEASFFMVEREITCVAHSSDTSAGTTQISSMETTEGYSNEKSVLKQDDFSENIGHQVSDGVSLSNAERLSVNGIIDSQGPGNEIIDGHVEYSSDLVMEMCSPTDIICESKNSEGMEDMLSKDSDMVDQLMGNREEASSFRTEREITSVAHSSDISVGVTRFFSMETTQGYKNDKPVLEQDDFSENIGHQLNDGISLSNTERSMNGITDPQDQANEISDGLVEYSSGLLTEMSSFNDTSRESQNSKDMQDMISPKDTDVADQLVGNQQEASILKSEMGITSITQSSDSSAGATEILSIETAQGYSTSKSSAKQDDFTEIIAHQLDGGISLSNTERLLVKGTTYSQGQGSEISDGHVGCPCGSVVEMCYSTNVTRKSQNSEDLKDSDNGLGVHRRETGSSTSLVVESQQGSDHILQETGPTDAQVCCLDASAPTEETGRLPTDSGATEVVSEVANMASDDILDDVSYLPLKSNISEDEANQHKEDPSTPSIGSSLLVEQEETVTGISISDATESFQVSNERVPFPASEHGEVGASSSGMSVEIIGQSSLSREISGNEYQNEPGSARASVDVQHQCSEQFEECPVVSVAIKEKEGAEVWKQYNNKGAPIESEDVSLNGCEGTLGPAVLPKDEADSHALEAETSSLISNEPDCGSPTIISCSEASKSEKVDQERSMGALDHVDSDAPEVEANNVSYGVVDPKDNDAFEDNRSFTFKVSSVVDLSEKETVSGWKPFQHMQPQKITQAPDSSGTLSSDFCTLESKTFEVISCGGSQISDEGNACKNLMCNYGDKTRTMAEKTAENGAAGGETQNDQLVCCGNDHQEEIRRLDPTTDVVSAGHDPKENTAAEVDERVSFKVNSMVDLSEKEMCHNWKPVRRVQSNDFPQSGEVSASTSSSICEIDAKVLQNSSPECPQTSGAKDVCRSIMGTAEDNTRVSLGKAAAKENNKEEKVPKETISMKHIKAVGSDSLHASTTPPASVMQVVQAGDSRVGFIEGSSIKSSVIATAQMSTLPDLNRSTSQYALYQQPFTDFQQVQLRAQIFVYGSIIQGTAPDEACMLASFGECDGGRSLWENVWRVAVERLHSQKTPLSNVKTPLHPHTGTRANEAMRQTIHLSEAFCTPGGAGSSKLPSGVFNSSPISSPLWTVSSTCRDGPLFSSMPKGSSFDSSKTYLTLQPYQSPQVTNYVGNNSPWTTQVASPGPWVFTPPTAVDATSHHPTLPISETGRVTSVGDSSTLHNSKKQHAHPGPFIHTGSAPIVSSGKSLAIDAKKTTVSPVKNASLESKPRKKRRNVVSEELEHVPSVPSWRDTVSVTAQPPTFVATAPIMSTMNVASGSLLSGSSPLSSTHDQILVSGEKELKVACPDEACGGIEQAKRQAEGAAALAATAVRHCQSFWSHLAIQEKSGVNVDLEAKLKSSAIVIAAAASVAMAAAAVAKVASDAALQARLMADEALITSKSGVSATVTSIDDDVKILGRVTPPSLLKGRDQTSNVDSVLVGVREAARKRVEAVSSATKRAENLDAVLKAAEMTAEAVSQAGTIIAMGETLPFTLAELVDAGPEGYWKVQQKSREKLVKSNDIPTERTNKDDVGEGISGSTGELNEKQSNKNKKSQIVEISKDSAENRMLVDGLQSGFVSSGGQGLGSRNNCTESDISKHNGVIPEIEAVPESASSIITNDKSEGQRLVITSNSNNFEEGSLVEVRPNEDGLGMVWFLAKISSLKDGKAFVSYTEHAHLEGPSQPTEWVPLVDRGGNAPRIRTPHPSSIIKNEVTKKRSRAARWDYNWSIGDKVDVWISNGWWEGMITEKSKEDETNLTIHFPARRETSVVRAWNLRPSLIWEDGRWIEWCRPMENNFLSHEGDTPQGKPPKKSRLECNTDPAVEVQRKDKMIKLPSIMELGKPETLKPLMLSASETVFNAGKDTSKDALGRKLTALQKDVSKVNIGVPKPGRKRKFMDVSNVADRGTKASKPAVWKSGKSQGPPLPSSRDVASSSVSKKKISSDVAADLQNRGKATSFGEKKNNEKSTGHDHNGNLMPNSVEPRRSVRRIQPTSRLLEGLQSSLIVSKIPAAPHDRGAKSQQRSSRGRNHA